MLHTIVFSLLTVMPAILGDVLPEPGALMVADRRIDIPHLPNNTVAYNPPMAKHLGNLYLTKL